MSGSIIIATAVLEDTVYNQRIASMEEGGTGPSHERVDDDEIARFVALTNCHPDQVEFFLGAAGSFDGAVSLFYGMFIVLGTASCAQTSPH